MANYKKYFTEEERKDAHREAVIKYRKEHPIETRACMLLQDYQIRDEQQNRGKGDLTVQWIIENIFSKPCVHCGKIGWDVIGCNRLDNSKPHTKDNVEPCCEKCNNSLEAERKSKQVGQYELNGKLVKMWKSACEAGRNGYTKQNIISCCNNKPHFNTHKGYIWKWVN